jgi:TonB family protein
LSILGVVFSDKLSSSPSISPESSIPIDWITIASDSQTNQDNSLATSSGFLGSFFKPVSEALASASEAENSISRDENQTVNTLTLNEPIPSSISLQNPIKNSLNSEVTQAPREDSNLVDETNPNLALSTTISDSTASEFVSQAPAEATDQQPNDQHPNVGEPASLSPHDRSGESPAQAEQNGSPQGNSKTGLATIGGKPQESKGANSGTNPGGQRSGSTPSLRPIAPTSNPTPTPVPTPAPTPVPTPPPAPEVFECVACPRPAYPAQARRSGHSGSVQVILDVSPSGSVVSAALGSSSGSPDLDQAAIATVQTWQFTATGDGRWGVPVYVDFELVE